MVDFNTLGNISYTPSLSTARDSAAATGNAAPDTTPQVGDMFKEQGEDLATILMAKLDPALSTATDNRVLDKPTRIFPDNYGRVKHLALQFSSYVGGTMRKEVLGAYKTLFLNMEPDTKFTMVVGSDRDRQDIEKVMKENNVPNPERIQFIKPGNSNITVWARDEMVSMYFPNDDKKTALMNQSTLHNWHDEDEKIPQYIVDANPSIVIDKEKRLVTDGGEVVSNNHETFVGYYSIAATAQKLKSLAKTDPAFKNQVVHYFHDRMGKVVLETPDEKTFPFKIVPQVVPEGMHERDFTLEQNPLYQRPITKGDQMGEGEMWVKAARELFEKEFGQKVTVMGADDPSTPEVEGPANDHLDMAITPFDENTVAVGDPSLVKRVIEKLSTQRRQEVLATLAAASDGAVDPSKIMEKIDTRKYAEQQHNFDAYAKTMKDHGYRVLRLPYAEPGWGTPNITYDNCLIERFKKDDGTDVKRVFLPVYGIKELDDMAMGVYKSEGFEVHPIPLGALATKKGALRCISNWLDRDPHK
jgi:hypothetical protein